MSSSPHQNSYPDEFHESQDTQESSQSFPNTPLSRTVAIIKSHALRHRFDIERRIQEASFEIVKERQMEFDTETDFDSLVELFHDDASSFSHGPVWVYVLERRRAVEVWKTVMGDQDPKVARQKSPNSLRALYGRSPEHNAVMGSPDAESAERQIASIFASSPVFPIMDLPDEQYGTLASVSSSTLSRLHSGSRDEEYSQSTPSTIGGSSGKLRGDGKPSFRARPVPSTTVNPDIVPRMTRSAALRAGSTVDKTESGPRAPLSKEETARTFANVPGHKRAETIAVASTAAPTVAPRMTRAASLRIGIAPTPADASRRKSMSSTDAGKGTFEGVPGHKRRESISVASTKAPMVAPRLNKSAALRASKEQVPPSSFMFKGPSVSKPAIPSRSNSQSLSQFASPPTSIRPVSQTGYSPGSRYAIPRSSSVVGHRPRSPSTSDSLESLSKADNVASTPGSKSRPRPISVCAPSISPRTNKSAALRAAKQEAEKAVASRRNLHPRVAPSSFKPITAV